MSPLELAETVIRTLSLELVQQHRTRLVPEWNVYSIAEGEPGIFYATAGIADAIVFNEENQPQFVFDWKSHVSPDKIVRDNHCAQLGKYLALTGCKQGAVVYMTTGVIHEVQAESQV